MLSPVEVSRLLEGVAAALRAHVEPHVGDRFALMQLRATGELLRNLAGRVEWALPELQAELAEMEQALAGLRAAGCPGHAAAGPSPVGSTEEALARRVALLEALADAIRWAQESDSEEARAIIARFLRSANDRERGRLQSGMYS